MKHFVPARWQSSQVKVALIGAGGSGSQVLNMLAMVHRALLAKGHPYGLHVLVVDPDQVSPSNIGRQAFYPCDVHSYKAITLVNRVNMHLGTTWSATVDKITTETKGLAQFDLVIGAVDNRRARLGILRCLEGAMSGSRYWLDLGNRTDDGQVILGQVSVDRKAKDDPWRLPHAAELFPELIDTALDSQEDDIPSCSLAEALQKQNLFVNPAVALQACNIIWQMFTVGELAAHGAFVNMKDLRVTPLAVCRDTWARFGVLRDGRRHKVVQPSRRKSATKKKEAA